MIICFSPHFIELGENVWTNLISTRRALISGQQSAHHAISGGIGITRVSFLHFFDFYDLVKKESETEERKKEAIETSRTTFTTECGNTLWFRLGNYLWLSNHLLCRTKRLLFEMLIHDREGEEKKRKLKFVFFLFFWLFFLSLIFSSLDVLCLKWQERFQPLHHGWTGTIFKSTPSSPLSDAI